MDISEKSCLDFKPLDEILTSMPNVDSGDLIYLLQRIQAEYGYLPQKVLFELSSRTGIAASGIYGVATFYEQFHLEPHGRHTIKCCRGTACHIKGGPAIINVIEKVLGVGPGETTEDTKFTFETVACLGTCFLAPVMMVNNDYYGHLTNDKIEDNIPTYQCDIRHHNH